MLEIKNSFLVKRILIANLTVFALFSTYAQQATTQDFQFERMQKNMHCKTNRKQKMLN
jgi:hypothetical protein